jgi:hypothetical protein
MYKLQPIVDTVLKQRRSKEERSKNHIVAINQMIQKYIKNGSKGDLNLRNTHITRLPDNLIMVGGNLSLYGTQITKLPDTLKAVGGGLYAHGLPITTLPDGLVVGGDLILQDTPIESFPDGLVVGGDLHLSGARILKKYTRKRLKEMLPGVKGDIFIN